MLTKAGGVGQQQAGSLWANDGMRLATTRSEAIAQIIPANAQDLSRLRASGQQSNRNRSDRRNQFFGAQVDSRSMKRVLYSKLLFVLSPSICSSNALKAS